MSMLDKPMIARARKTATAPTQPNRSNDVQGQREFCGSRSLGSWPVLTVFDRRDRGVHAAMSHMSHPAPGKMHYGKDHDGNECKHNRTLLPNWASGIGDARSGLASRVVSAIWGRARKSALPGVAKPDGLYDKLTRSPKQFFPHNADHSVPNRTNLVRSDRKTGRRNGQKRIDRSPRHPQFERLLHKSIDVLDTEEGLRSDSASRTFADAANIGRSTFYAHYTSKDHLKRGRPRSASAPIAPSIDPRMHPRPWELIAANVLGFSLAMFEHAAGHKDLLRALGRRAAVAPSALGTYSTNNFRCCTRRTCRDRQQAFPPPPSRMTLSSNMSLARTWPC